MTSSIKNMIKEMNTLCGQYLHDNAPDETAGRIRGLFQHLKDKGFSIVIPSFEPGSPEIRVLSRMGKENLQKMIAVRHLKTDAIRAREFEMAADFRTLERHLESLVRTDFMNQFPQEYFRWLDTGNQELVFSFYDGVSGSLGKLGDLFILSPEAKKRAGTDNF